MRCRGQQERPGCGGGSWTSLNQQSDPVLAQLVSCSVWHRMGEELNKEKLKYDSTTGG